MKRPVVTVIIPAYNAEKYIGRCLDSVLKQSFKDFEILVIDDGSTDKTGDIVKRYAENDRRINYVRQKNEGVARTRNKAMKLAKGDYVAFIDNDDYIDDDYIEALLPREGEDVVMSGYKRPDENGKIIKEVCLKNVEWSKFVVPTPWAKICKKDYLLNNKIEFLDNNIGEDVYFDLLTVLSTDKIRIVDYVGYNWFFNNKSVSNTKQKNFNNLDVFKLLNSSYDELKRRGLLENNYEVMELFFFRYIVWFLLFSSKGRSKAEIEKKYDELFLWLGERFPDYEKNKLLKPGALPGEVKSTRLAYEIFVKFHKMKLGKLLAVVYAKI